MARKNVEIFPKKDFGFVHDIDENPDRLKLKLHNHDDLFEVLLLLNGDCEFYVEGNVYRLNPYDIVFTRPFELHRMLCLSEKTYDRLILYIKEDYFHNNHCPTFLDIFLNRQLGTDNCISSDITNPLLVECAKRLQKYCTSQAYDVAERTVFEYLYLLNECRQMSENFYVKDERVRKIIMFINSHLAEDISLDLLASKFFVAKNYMCSLFKKHTGYTINQYISRKRVLLVRELYKNGQSLMQASMNAGFHSYANFYKVYVKQAGISPRKDI